MTKAEGAARFGFLDTLRFFAAFSVCCYHFLETQAPTPWIQAVLTSGVNTGAVVIFFIISGFVMPSTIRQGVDLREFGLRRILRIFPLYLAALAVIAIGGATGLLTYWSYMWDSSPNVWLANLLIVQDFFGLKPFLGVSWTLALEIIWYTLFVAALMVFRRRASLIFGFAAPLGLLVLAGLSVLFETRIPLGRPAMIYAAALGWQFYDCSQGRVSRPAMLGWVAIFIGVTTLTNIVSFGVFRHDHVQLGPTLMWWILSPVFFAAVLLAPKLRHAPGIATGIIPALGRAGYSIYLLHPIAVAAVTQYAGNQHFLLQMLVFIGLTGGLTAAGYLGVEKPAIRVGKRLSVSGRSAWLHAKPA